MLIKTVQWFSKFSESGAGRGWFRCVSPVGQLYVEFDSSSMLKRSTLWLD